jgi:hypothetical protein
MEREGQNGNVYFVTKYFKFHDCSYTRVRDFERSMGNLENPYTSTTKARKIQLKNELKSPQVTMNDYVLKLKDISDALSSIGSHVDDDDLVAFCLNGLRGDYKWKLFITSIYVRDNLPKFDQLVSMMITAEMNLQGSSSRSSQSQVFYAGIRGRDRYTQNRGRGSFFNKQQQSNQ